MAFTASMLARTINESAGYSYDDNTVPHEFIGESMSSVTAEIQFGIMSEAAEFMDIVAASDDLLAEAAVTAPDKFFDLQENVLETIKNGILKFWKKIKEFVKGLIEKLKAAFYRLTGKTDKWVSVMRPKIDEAARRSGSTEFKYDMYPYDHKYIITDMSANLGAVMSAWDSDVGNSVTRPNILKTALQNIAAKRAGTKAGDVAAAAAGRMSDTVHVDRDKEISDRMTDSRDSYNKSLDNYRNTDTAKHGPDDDDVKAAVEDYEKQTEDIEKQTEDWVENFPGNICKHFGVTGSSTMENLWSEVKEKGRGSSEKSTQTIGKDAKTFLGIVESSKKTIDSLKKLYEGHLNTLTKYEAAINKMGMDLKVEKEKDLPGNLVSAANSVYKATYTQIMKQTQAYETAMNSARQINISLIEEMTGAYMSALTAFAGYKEPKKEK